MVHKHKETITVAAGSGSTNTPHIDGECRYIYVEPTTSTTKYKFNLTDEDSDTILQSDWIQGTYAERSDLVMHGPYTINLTNVSANEDVVVKLLVREY